MRKLWMVALVVALGAATALAGGAPGGGRQGRRGGRFGARGGMRQRFSQGMRGGRDRVDVFGTARRLTELADDKKAALQGLEDQYTLEESEAMAELAAQLNKKYVALIIEILPAEEKPKYEKVYAAMAEREEQRRAARKVLIAALEKLRTDQGVERRGPINMVPSGKSDIIRGYIKLTEEQQTQADEIRRDGFAAMREQMRGGQRPDFRDREAMARFMERMRKAREDVETATAEAMVKVLTDEQKKAYEPAAKAYDDYQATLKAIDETYQKKLVEAVGEEKAKELQERRPMFGGFGGPPPFGGGRQPGGRQPGGRPGGGGGDQPPAAPRTEF